MKPVDGPLEKNGNQKKLFKIKGRDAQRWILGSSSNAIRAQVVYIPRLLSQRFCSVTTWRGKHGSRYSAKGSLNVKRPVLVRALRIQTD